MKFVIISCTAIIYFDLFRKQIAAAIAKAPEGVSVPVDLLLLLTLATLSRTMVLFHEFPWTLHPLGRRTYCFCQSIEAKTDSF